MGNFKTFEELVCWQEARSLRVFVKEKIASKLPKSEQYTLNNQITRSVRSIGNNIAEGFGRFHFQENIQFCRIARGSLYETLDHVLIAIEEEYISEIDLKEFRVKFDKSLLVLNGYIKYLRDKKNLK